MTQEELAKIGILDASSKKHSYRCYITGTDLKLDIPSNYTIANIYEAIYNEGIRRGILEGEAKKVNEIKSVLNIEHE